MLWIVLICFDVFPCLTSFCVISVAQECGELRRDVWNQMLGADKWTTDKFVCFSGINAKEQLGTAVAFLQGSCIAWHGGTQDLRFRAHYPAGYPEMVRTSSWANFQGTKHFNWKIDQRRHDGKWHFEASRTNKLWHACRYLWYTHITLRTTLTHHIYIYTLWKKSAPTGFLYKILTVNGSNTHPFCRSTIIQRFALGCLPFCSL